MVVRSVVTRHLRVTRQRRMRSFIGLADGQRRSDRNTCGTTAVCTVRLLVVFSQLGKMKFIDVREYKGITLIDIREYYEDKKSGEMKPGKKGISLQKDQWEVRVRPLRVFVAPRGVVAAWVGINGACVESHFSTVTAKHQQEIGMARTAGRLAHCPVGHAFFS